MESVPRSVVPGPAGGAAGFEKFPVQVEHPAAPGPLMEIVHILGDEEELPLPGFLQASKGQMGGIGMDGGQSGAAVIVKAVNPGGGGGKPLRGGDFFHPMSLPQAIGIPESGETGFGRNAGPGKDDEGVAHFSNLGFGLTLDKSEEPGSSGEEGRLPWADCVCRCENSHLATARRRFQGCRKSLVGFLSVGIL